MTSPSRHPDFEAFATRIGRIFAGPRRKRMVFDGDKHGCIWATSHSTNADGYLRISRTETGKATWDYAHRMIFEAIVGPIPDGYDIHHHCDRTDCLNWNHMEAITKADHRRETNDHKVQIDRAVEEYLVKKEGFGLTELMKADYPRSSAYEILKRNEE